MIGNIKFTVPEKCPCCGAKWSGGCQVPRKPMPDNARVFYNCGASLSIKRRLERYAITLLFKSCNCLECEPDQLLQYNPL